MRVEISRQAEKDLAKLETATRKCILKELLDLENDISGKDIKKLTGQKNCWRLRVGDYRVIMEVNQRRLIITALHVGHRKEIYR